MSRTVQKGSTTKQLHTRLLIEIDEFDIQRTKRVKKERSVCVAAPLMQYFNYGSALASKLSANTCGKMKRHRPCMLITSRSPRWVRTRIHMYIYRERERNAFYTFGGVYSTHIDFHFHATSTNPMERNHLAKCCCGSCKGVRRFFV